ncbi:MAG: response regulator [Candidatus Scalindua sp.]|nr:response regulator [Candidatus Scalindua sp.]
MKVKYNILIVDDEVLACNYLSNIIEKKAGQNYNITAVHSGECAVCLVSKVKYNMVLLDIMMPGIGGMEALKRIKQVSQNKDICVVMLTSLVNETFAKHAIAEGATDYITKPVDIDYLINTVLPVYTVMSDDCDT